MSQTKENIEAKLAQYVEGTLDEAGQAEIEQHLAEHEQHRHLMSELIAARDILRELPRATAPHDMAETVQGHLERSALLADGLGKGGRFRQLNRWSQGLAVAAILILATGLGFVVYVTLPASSPTAFTVVEKEVPAGRGVAAPNGQASAPKAAEPPAPIASASNPSTGQGTAEMDWDSLLRSADLNRQRQGSAAEATAAVSSQSGQNSAGSSHNQADQPQSLAAAPENQPIAAVAATEYQSKSSVSAAQPPAPAAALEKRPIKVRIGALNELQELSSTTTSGRADDRDAVLILNSREELVTAAGVRLMLADRHQQWEFASAPAGNPPLASLSSNSTGSQALRGESADGAVSASGGQTTNSLASAADQQHADELQPNQQLANQQRANQQMANQPYRQGQIIARQQDHSQSSASDAPIQESPLQKPALPPVKPQADENAGQSSDEAADQMVNQQAISAGGGQYVIRDLPVQQVWWLANELAQAPAVGEAHLFVHAAALAQLPEQIVAQQLAWMNQLIGAGNNKMTVRTAPAGVNSAHVNLTILIQRSDPATPVQPVLP
ncbi:MAG: zf-HC2 domain-containing protein [Phycisphaerales bacterium]|nr:zf-HC2 domain-containing protein [Phycisphaerales bacterium]